MIKVELNRINIVRYSHVAKWIVNKNNNSTLHMCDEYNVIINIIWKDRAL